MTNQPEPLSLTPKEREFTDALAFVVTLASTPPEHWPSAGYLHQLAKEITHAE